LSDQGFLAGDLSMFVAGLAVRFFQAGQVFLAVLDLQYDPAWQSLTIPFRRISCEINVSLTN